MRRKLVTVAIYAGALLLLGAQPAAAAREAIVLPSLGGKAADAAVSAINHAGVVVGASEVEPYVWHAVRWENGIARDLGTLGGRSSQAEGIDDQGRIVGTSQVANGDSHAFVWEDGKMRDLGVVGTEKYSHAYGISNGRIVGEYSVTDNLGGARAFVLQDGRQTDIDVEQGSLARDVNARGQVAGTSRVRDFLDPENRFRRAFIWEDGVARELGNLGGTYSESYGMNNAGHVVGQSTTKEDELTAFFWDGTTMHRLPSPDESYAHAAAINDSDVIVGVLGRGDIGIVWETPKTEPTELPAPEGGSCPVPRDINNDGVIAGRACFVTETDFVQVAVIWR
jgi:probable HAF family extracellular repeat protein